MVWTVRVRLVLYRLVATDGKGECWAAPAGNDAAGRGGRDWLGMFRFVTMDRLGSAVIVTVRLVAAVWGG